MSFQRVKSTRKAICIFLQIPNSDRPIAVYSLNVIISVGWCSWKAKRGVQLAFSRYQQQYPNDGLTLTQWSNAHDRFIVCDNTVWICGSSIKDAGRRMFALVKTGLKPDVVLSPLAETILNYLRACEEAFLLSRVKREDLIGKHVLAVDEKFYVTDLGLRRAVIGDRRGEDVDQALENVVYSEMRRRGYEVTVGRVKEKEVDFVCSREGKRLYIQVAYLMPTKETREREFGALMSVPDQYRKIVLSMDNFDFSRDGVEHLHLPDFILDDK